MMLLRLQWFDALQRLALGRSHHDVRHCEIRSRLSFSALPFRLLGFGKVYNEFRTNERAWNITAYTLHEYGARLKRAIRRNRYKNPLSKHTRLKYFLNEFLYRIE